MNPATFITHHHLTYWLAAVLVRGIAVALAIMLTYWAGENMSPGATAFWKGVLSDGANPSWSRVASSILLLACIAWDTLYTVRTNQLPDGGALTSQSLFISSPYLINVTGKAAMMIATRSNGSSPPPAPPGDTAVNVTVGKQ